MATVSFFFLFFSLFFTCQVSATTNGGFAVDLIHRDSPKSPYYNPSYTPSDRLKAAVRRSASRLNHFRLSSTIATPSSTDSNSSIISTVIPNQFEYLMSLSIGTPPFKILAIPDTGSDLIWTQCKPCTNCYKQIPPMFDPTESTSYQNVSCDSSKCSDLSRMSCGIKNECNYDYRYGDRSYTIGVLSSETLVFESTNGSNVYKQGITFGCTHESRGTFEAHGSGLVGLGGGSLSLVSQLGSSINGKFSYCLVPFESTNSSSKLIFGDAGVVTGKGVVSTPIIPHPPLGNFYYLSLEALSVGGTVIPIESTNSSSSSDATGNIIIDSGTTLTYIPSGTYQSLINSLSDLVKLKQTIDPQGLFDLCFVAQSNDSLPDITFKFTGAEVVLPSSNTFATTSEGILCLAMKSDDQLGVSIFGNIAQQNFHIGYDLVGNEVSFAATDCTKLD